MHIIHVIGSLDPASGGPPAVAARLAAAQAALGHEVTLLAYGDGGPPAERLPAYTAIPGFARVYLRLLPPASKLERLFCRAGREAIRELLQGSAVSHAPASPKIDAVHIHGVWEPLLRAAAIEA